MHKQRLVKLKPSKLLLGGGTISCSKLVLSSIYSLTDSCPFINMSFSFHLIRQLYMQPSVPAWAKGFDQDTLVFSTIGVTSSIPQFRKPEKIPEGEITKC